MSIGIRGLAAAGVLCVAWGCLVIPVGRTTTTTTVRIEVQERAAVLAATLAPRLAELERWYERQIPGMSTNPRRASRVLQRTESRLLDILDAPELAPMRDLVQYELEAAQGAVRQAAGATDAPGRIHGDVRLAQSPPSGGKLSRAIRLVESLINVLRRRAEGNDLLVDVCFLSEPDAASVALHPVIDPQDVRETRTQGTIPNVWRGRYSYRVQLGGFQEASCSEPCGSDLLQPLTPLFDCDLELIGAAEVSKCEEQDRIDPDCEG